MCRVFMYIGEPEYIDKFLFSPDSSLVKQAYSPQYMQMINLAGFGMVAWHYNGLVPLIYKSLDMPFFDNNLKSISTTTKTHCMIAHIRGVTLDSTSIVSKTNIHPFIDDDNSLAFAHNGALYGLEQMIPDLVKIIPYELVANIRGTTDTEWMHALFLAQLESPDDQNDLNKVKNAVYKMLEIIKRLRSKHKITLPSAINLFLTNGSFLVALRYYYDFGIYSDLVDSAHLVYHSMWFTFGHRYKMVGGEFQMTKGGRNSLILASEPLTKDTTSWLQVPQYSLMSVQDHNGSLSINTEEVRLRD